jgi:plasmid stabilization system protein ParE
MKIEWRPESEADRDRIIAFIEIENPIAARHVLAAILAAVDSLADFSQRGRPGLVDGTRELVALNPYIIVYEFDETAGQIRILRIWHAAQNR